MNSLKKNNNNIKMNSIIYLLLLVHFSSNSSIQPCYFNGNSNITDYLGSNKTDHKEKKERCFALSYFFNNSVCCYNNITNECMTINNETYNNETDIVQTNNNETNDFQCPETPIIPNNCGFAGIFEPLDAKVCNGISLVQGYCCYTLLKLYDVEKHSCLRTKVLSKDKNKPSNALTKYVKAINSTIEILKVECKQFNKNYNFILYIIFVIIIFF